MTKDAGAIQWAGSRLQFKSTASGQFSEWNGWRDGGGEGPLRGMENIRGIQDGVQNWREREQEFRCLILALSGTVITHGVETMFRKDTVGVCPPDLRAGSEENSHPFVLVLCSSLC